MRHYLHLAVALLAASAAAQTTYRVAGHVVDASDGHPLRHAAITLFETPATNKQVARTETDDTGAFSVTKIPAGKYRTQAAVRGYITAAYDEHNQYSTAIVTGAGLDTESLTFRLQAAATISGRVTDEAGDPVQNVDVTLFRETNENGTRRITQFRNARTNDLGAYEIPHLPPGAYYATARGTPWYAVYQPNDAANNLGVASDIDPALSVVYPLTFYPAATDSGGASVIELKPGTRFHADFQLTPQPAAHLTVQLPSPAAGPGGNLGLSMPQLQQKIFDSIENTVQQRVQFTGQNLEIEGLASGSYILRRANGGANSTQAVQVSGGGTTADESAPPPTYGSLTLILGNAADNTKLPQIQRLTLRPAESEEGNQPVFGPGLTGNIKDGQAVIPSVPPGDYRIQSGNGRWHADSVLENGKTTSGNRFHVTGEGQTATVILGNGSAVITGFVRRLSGPSPGGVAGAMVVLVPAGGDYSSDLYRRDQSDLDGSFRFADVLPGNYLLVAIQDGWTLEWGKPESMAPYLQKAVPVIVPQDAHGAMPITEPVPAQPR